MENILDLKAKALKLFRNKKYKDAYPLFCEINKRDPEDAECWVKRFNLSLVLGEIEEGLEAVSRALELFPDRGDFYYFKAYFILVLETARKIFDIGGVKLHRGPSLNPERLEECVKMFEKAIEKGTRFRGEAWNRKGDALMHLEKWEEAIEAYDRAMEECGENAGILFNKGKALIKLKRWKEAEKTMDKVVKEAPDDVEAWFYKGLALLNMEKLEDSLTAFERVIKLAPHIPEAHTFRGMVLELLGRTEEAEKEYEWLDGIMGVSRELGEVEYDEVMEIIDDDLFDEW